MATPEEHVKMNQHVSTVQSHAAVMTLILAAVLLVKTVKYLVMQQMTSFAPLIRGFLAFCLLGTLLAIPNFNMFRIAQENIRCLGTSRYMLDNFVDRHKIGLVTLSETWNRQDSIQFKDWDCRNLFKNRTGTDQKNGIHPIHLGQTLPGNKAKL